ncbi:Hypothetical protein PP7435_CHR4-1290 [Komagataella phaffii CBS 7435]|uniref:Uncharacterized protein n=2 Tax=Komagataella phaffii TaxID=460519 RepID=C4R8E6_KOMPG|nr:Hypothetical protein PAS_chr4_0611 [Komagataella phaffii GS115]AOA64532.1 GQ67_04984T0 [Komagataella phaffii]KAI0463301.1 hypothetical protein LJB42_003322 [Komagataella kurtzmanii]CAH2450728.1 Hypothetical protein BQ9382_C4-1865 [Komagataella phaffii CBS 7435]AOA70422.1 GQ68_04965T0 [Komagataella phaffii GS115]CAY71871.1 Hypothetical protein PAS_chr4_0611 [Komagataella phaffii GS115]
MSELPNFNFKSVSKLKITPSQSSLEILPDEHSSSQFVHPIELTIQALLEQPLEALNNKLQTLYESQIMLLQLLRNIQRVYDNVDATIESNTRSNDPNSYRYLLDTFKERIKVLKLRIIKINQMTETIERRVESIESKL